MLEEIAITSPDFRKVFRITKVNATKREVSGVVTSEALDLDGESCDYATTAPYYKAWSAEFEKATDGKSLGNLRLMHQPIIAGKVIHLDCDDATKTISIVGKVVNDDVWKLCEEGCVTGWSQGGKYVRVWKSEDGVRHYTAKPSEVSLVDKPCNPDATFEYVKADGTVELRKFASPTRIALDEGQRTQLVAILNRTLTQSNSAALATKFAHWNVKGDGFHPTHKLFDQIYEVLTDAVDTIAERVTALGGIADGLPVGLPDPHYGATGTDDVAQHFKAMADLIGNLSNVYRDAAQEVNKLNDLNTQDVYISLGREVEKQLYFLEATLRDGAEKCAKVADTIPESGIVSAQKLKKIVGAGLEKAIKTKRVDGEDLRSSAFLIVGDPDKTDTWNLPVKFSTEEKTKSHLRDALSRFDQVEGASAEDKAKAKKKLLALCAEHGIEAAENKKSEGGSTAMNDKVGKTASEADAIATPNSVTPVKIEPGAGIEPAPGEGKCPTCGEKCSDKCADGGKCCGKCCDKCKAAKKTVNDGLHKSMNSVANLAYVLLSISGMQSQCAQETAAEGDSSTMPAKLSDWLKQGVEIIVAMAQEEGSELVADTQAPGTMELAAQSSIAKALMPELVKRNPHTKATLAKLGSLQKCLDESDEHMGNARKCCKAAHQHADDLVSQNPGGVGVTDDNTDNKGKAAESEIQKAVSDALAPKDAELLKVVGERDALKSENEVLKADVVEAEKAIGLAAAKLDELLSKEVSPKGIAKAVSKDQDVTGAKDPVTKTNPTVGPKGDKDVLKSCLASPSSIG